jgi:CRISPR-associated protein Cas2
MTYVLIYDIESDRIRTKVAQACEDAGLERVQFSAFWGEMSANRCEELLLRCRELIGDETARIHVLPICSQCFARRSQITSGEFKSAPQAPRDRNAAVIFLPDAGSASAHPTPKPRQPESEKPPAPPAQRSVARAQADVARKLRRKDKPVGTQDDPWEDTA